MEDALQLIDELQDHNLQAMLEVVLGPLQEEYLKSSLTFSAFIMRDRSAKVS